MSGWTTYLKKWTWLRAAYRCVRPLWPGFPPRALRSYVRFWRTYRAYHRLAGRPPCRWADLDPQIGDWLPTTPLSYYFYQDTWAFHKIARQRPSLHIDIGSTALLVGCLAGVVRTVSLDIRPLSVRLPGLLALSGSITQLPLRDRSVASLSSLCVVEHIGLGRYGDPLDPEGTVRAARELTRVLAPGGDLYVSAPCGRSYVAFNAHRCFARDEFLAMFPGLRLREFVLVNNRGVTERPDPDPAAGLHVGLFHFTS